MKERPILFSGPMVRAILEGRKTQTRRVMKPQPDTRTSEVTVCRDKWTGVGTSSTGVGTCQWDSWQKSSFAGGDKLWVRETCRAHELTDAEAEADTYGVVARKGLEAPPYGLDGVVYPADGAFREIKNTLDASDDWGWLHAYRGQRGATVPAIHMPRWASRITLEITAVRAERLKSISAADARAEGLEYREDYIAGQLCRRWRSYGSADGWFPEGRDIAPIHSFQTLWDGLNAARGHGWDANPWVWVVEFRRIES